MRCCALALAYIAGAKLGLALTFSHEHVTSVWPPTGIAVAMLFLFGLRLWPGVFVGALVANLLDGAPIQVAAGIAVGNTVAPLAAAFLLRRLKIRPALDRLRDVIWLVFGAGLGAMTISATLGTVVLYMAGQDNVSELWRIWWVGDAMGVVLLAPLLLTVLSKPRRDSFLVQNWKQSVALLTTFAAVTAIAVQTNSVAGYAVIPLALLVAMRLEQEGAAAALLIMSAIDLWHTTAAPQAGMSVEAQLMGLQGVNATIGLILLAFSVVMFDRRRTREQLSAAADELEDRVRSRTDELRNSEERFAEAQRLAHIGSFQWDAATDRNNWSDELFHIYGLDPEDGPPGFDEYLSFIRSDRREATSVKISEGIAAGTSLSHEYPVELRDGTQKWVHAYIEVLKDDSGTMTGLRGTCQDVTERKAAEDAQRASETRFRALVQSAPDAVVVIDCDGSIVLMNEQTTRLLGYTSNELIGQSVDVLLPADLQASHRNDRQLYLGSPTARPMGGGRELSALRKDGVLVPVDISLSPVETDEGMLVFALMRDASERRRVEDTLRLALEKERQAANDLRKLDDAKSAFLSAVSHELRTPLTAILGFSELLQDPDIRDDEETLSDIVERLQFSAIRLGGLLGDLLDIDRLQRGILEPHRRTSLLRDLIERAVGPIDAAGHVIVVNIEDGLVSVDSAQTERIVENLVSNAVKYTPLGSRITLDAVADETGGISIVVSDEGPGVPDELKASIFEAFVRGDTGSFTPGTGLGLALVDRFARLHGGSAWVEEGATGGAQFHVRLPGPPADTSEPAVA